jgi:uncharacterized GH25 family protein
MCKAAGVAAFLVVLLAGAPAAAHDLWLEPSTFRPAPHSLVSVSVLVGQGFAGETVPRDPEYLERFVLTGSEGTAPVVGFPGADPAGTVRVGERGAATLLYRRVPQPIVLEAEKFESYLREEGLEHVIAARVKAGKSNVPGRERYGRCAKALLAVGGASGTATQVLGCPFEIVPLDELPKAGGTLRVQLLWNHAPAAGILLRARREEDPGQVWSAPTDANGRVSVPMARSGFWLLTAVHMTAASKGSDADWSSEWASLSFEMR